MRLRNQMIIFGSDLFSIELFTEKFRFHITLPDFGSNDNNLIPELNNSNGKLTTK